MKRIRVLIVEGSPTTREAIRQQFGREPDLELAGLFSNGRVALAQLTDLSPDVVVLDVAEPDLEGLKTLTTLRQAHPTLPVVVFSQLTQRGSQVTVDALLQGANEYVTKSGTQIEECDDDRRAPTEIVNVSMIRQANTVVKYFEFSRSDTFITIRCHLIRLNKIK